MKKGMTRRRLLALVLCLAMLFSCVPQGAIPVFAAGDDTASQGQPETEETTTPTEPEVTTEPTEPEATTEPTEPEDTTAPTEPEVTTEPTQPEVTTEPTEPEDTTAPTEPEVTTEPTQPEDTTAPTEPEVTTEPTEPQNPAEPAQPQNPAVPLAGTEVVSGDLTDTITYTITEEKDSDGTTYHVLTLTGTGAMPDYTNITYREAPWYSYRKTLRRVTLEEGITSVGSRAFYYSTKFAILQLPSTLTTIGESAFEYCTGLTTLNLGANSALTTIGESAFFRCEGLTAFNFNICSALITIENSAFGECTGLTGSLDLSKCSSLETIGAGAFTKCSGLTGLELPEGLAAIGDNAFSYCSGLTTLRLPASLTTTGKATFSNCSGLTAVELPEGLTSIGDNAFLSCKGLTALDLPESITSIGKNAFHGCSGLTAIELPEGITTIENSAFGSCSGLTSVKLPAGLTTIGSYAFFKCTGLTAVEFPEGVTSIGSSAFSGCTRLAAVDFPVGLTTIGSSAFSGCTRLAAVDFPVGLTTIESSTFLGCIGLTTIDLPEKLTSIGDSAFSGCTGLTTLAFPEGLTAIGNKAFYECYNLTSADLSGCSALATIGNSAFYRCVDLNNLKLPEGLTSIGNSTFYWCSSLTNLDLPESLITIGSNAFSKCSGLSTLELPAGLTTIKGGAFSECTGLATLDLPEGITAIEAGTFSGCTGLTAMKLPKGVTAIGDNAFKGCTHLTTLDLSGCASLATIGEYAFRDCYSLTALNLSGCADLTTVKEYAFDGCGSLTTLDFSGCESLTSIDGYVCYQCTNLTVVDFSGCSSLATIGGNAFSYCRNLTTLDLSGCTALTTINYNAFSDCVSLTGPLDFSECISLTTIGTSAFRGCVSLTGSLDFSNCPNLTTIKDFAFDGCSSLTGPLDFSGCRKLTEIGDHAFNKCVELTGPLDFSDCQSLSEIGMYAFSGCTSLTGSLDFSNCGSLTEIGLCAFTNCSSLTGPLNLSNCLSLTTIEESTFAGCSGLTTLELPVGLTTIENSAFSACSGLTTLNLEECTSLTTITNRAFSGCRGLTTLKLPVNITTIGEYAFNNCDGLKVLDLCDLPELSTIQSYAFYDCDGFETLNLSNLPKLTTIQTYAFSDCDALVNLSLSDCLSLNSVGGYAFANCDALTNLRLSNCSSLYSISGYAFYNCSNLNSIAFEGQNKLASIYNTAFSGTQVISVFLAPTDAVSADGMANLLAALPKIPILLTVGGANTRNFVFSEELLKEVQDTRYRIVFSPGFLTFTQEESGSVPGAAPLNTLEGFAWADSQGVVYLLNEADKTASLAYLPSELETYVVPETVADDYRLTSVSSHTLARAFWLEEITFENSKIVALEDFALAGCLTLCRVNGQTTVQGATDLFSEEIGESPFIGTGLQDESQSVVSPNTKIDASPSEDATFTISAQVSQSVWNGEWITGTGNPVTITASIYGSGAHNFWYRIYLLVSNGQFNLGDLQMMIDKEYEDENGVKFTLHSHPQLAGLYYVDVSLPVGATWNRQLKLNYPTLTPGGQVLVWAESGEVGTDTTPQTRPTEGHYSFTWETESSPYAMSVTNSIDTYGYIRSDVRQPITLSPDLSWQVKLAANARPVYGAFDASLAQDPVRQVVYTMTFTLPDGLSWNKTLSGDIRPLILSGDYWCLGENPILKIAPDSNTYVQKVTAVLVEDKLVITIWQAAKGQSFPSNPFLSISLARGTVEASEDMDFDSARQIALQAETQVYYTYDQPLVLNQSTQWSSVPPERDLRYEKTSSNVYLDYSNGSYYQLLATNETIFNHTLVKISDPLPTDLFITPQGIQALFTLSTGDLDNGDLAMYLTLTISGARRYQYGSSDNALGNVTLSDGKTQYLLTAEMTDQYGTAFEDNVEVTITLGDNEGNLKVAFGEENAEEVPMDNLEYYFQTHGLALLHDTQYTVTWNFESNHEILSGDAYLLRIPVEPKSSFQLLEKDWVTFRGATTFDAASEYRDEYYDVLNQAIFTDSKAYSKSLENKYRRDYAIQKSAGKSSVQNGDILDYSIDVYGIDQRNGLPVVDAVSGTLCLLAPVSENKYQRWTDMTEIFTASDGTQYYLLELPDSAKESGRYTYKGVWLNGYFADSVTVIAANKLKDEEKAKYNHSKDYSSMGNALANDGYVTEIRWYLSSGRSNVSGYRTLSYSVLVDVAYSLKENALSGIICNTAYLNDRDDHRLFYPTGSIPIKTVGADKKILEENGQKLTENSIISSGETVHYRLEISNWIPRDLTVESQHLKDVLPSTYGIFQWSTENVKIRYALKSGTPTKYFNWDISYDTVNQTYVIKWPENLQVPGNDTLYIYVDLTFPDDSSGEESLWTRYCDEVQENPLVNTFHFINVAYSVSHSLALPGSAYIQKGVMASKYYDSYAYRTLGQNADLRYYSEPAADGNATMEERFYILLYNDGPGPLYLSQLIDQFPEGTLKSVKLTTLITKSEYFAGLPHDLNLVQAEIETTYDESAVYFYFKPSTEEAGMPTITMDDATNEYYLKPHQAIAFCYECRIGTDLQYWESAVAMPLYDPYDAGVEVAQISQVYNNYNMSNKIRNDGNCIYWTVTEGSDRGYSSLRAEEGWVSSTVPLRKETVAGLEKRVLNKRGWDDVELSYDGTAGPLDSLQWELTVYNDGTNIIDGFTITDTLPERYILDKGDVALSGLWKTPDTPYILFSIADVVTEGEKVKEIKLTTGQTVPVDGIPFSIGGGEVVLYYNDTEQLVMELTVQLSNGTGIIWPHENVKLTYWSKNCTNTNTYTTYVNSAVLTTRQELNYDKVSHGRVECDESGEPAGILARAIVVISGGYSTGSEKTVTEVGGADNTASSDQIGSITLTQTDGGYSHFTYELQVDNSATGAKGMKWITLIDNLPQLDDTMTLNPKNQRGSEFQVEFAANPRVKVWYVTEEGQKVDITSKAMIQYSDKVTFGSGDWGKVGSIPESDGWGASSAGARSIRIYIPSGGETPAVPAGATLHVSFECQVKMDKSVAPGCTAWNSFGYRYQMVGDTYTLEAAPLEVGVRIPDYPRIQKVLTDETGEAIAAQEETAFNFLVYEDERISGDFATGAALLQALKDAGRKFTITKVTVPKGASQAELKLEDQKICTYTPEDGWTETNNPWVWTDGGSYTVVELGDKPTVGLGSYQDYEFASLDYVPDNSYTFQYNKSTSQLIRGENTLALRKLQIQKVDQADQSHKLSGAVFGLYSPNSGDQLTGDALQTAATALELTTGQIQELKGKLIITHNGKNYYLYRLGKTDENGRITWDNLPGMSYCYVELWAPEGYYITQNDPVEVSFQEGDAYLRSVTHTVTNKQIVYLPKTGGMGRWQIPALGLLLCAAVVTVFLGKRRKKAA